MKKYFLFTVLGVVCASLGLRAQTESPAGPSAAVTPSGERVITTEKGQAITTETGQRIAAEGQHVVVTPSDVKWGEAPPGLPAGAKLAVLEGDPTKPGPFTVRLKTPDGYKVAPHTHPTTEKITVLSGTFRIGSGPTADSSKAKALKPGGFVILPAGMQHYASTKGQTIIQISSEGPFVISYVNPQDDPTNAKR